MLCSCLSCPLCTMKKKNLLFWQRGGKESRKLGREEKTMVLDSRAGQPASPHCSSSVTIHIYSGQRKDWRLFPSNLLIKSCQSCLNAEHFMALVIEGRKFPSIRFMGLDLKPNWNSFTNPRGKMIHLCRVGKSIFITFILPTPHFYSLPELLLFPSWCQVNQISLESLAVLTGSFQPGWFSRGARVGLFCTAWVGPPEAVDLRPGQSACGWEPHSETYFLCSCIECYGWP